MFVCFWRAVPTQPYPRDLSLLDRYHYFIIFLYVLQKSTTLSCLDTCLRTVTAMMTSLWRHNFWRSIRVTRHLLMFTSCSSSTATGSCLYSFLTSNSFPVVLLSQLLYCCVISCDFCSECEYALLDDVIARLHVTRDEFLQQTNIVVFRMPRRRFENTVTSSIRMRSCDVRRSSQNDERRLKQSVVRVLKFE